MSREILGARKMAIMDTWRLIPLETHNAFTNMAIDEAILTARIADEIPNTLRFYLWHPGAITIGRHQLLKQEDIETAKKYKIDIVRRITDGGTTYQDQGSEVTYSVIAKTADLGKNMTIICLQICEALRDGLRLLGISADCNKGDTEDCPKLAVRNKTLSISSQTIRNGMTLHHGTVLLNDEAQKMFGLFHVGSKNKDVTNSQIADRFTSVEAELRHQITPETVANALAQGFRAMLKISLQPSILTPYEELLAKKLCEDKYSVNSWNKKGNRN
jgi:lipoate-protein ligase A